MLEIARERADEIGREIDLRVGDMQALDFPDAKGFEIEHLLRSKLGGSGGFHRRLDISSGASLRPECGREGRGVGVRAVRGGCQPERGLQAAAAGV